MDWLDCPVIEIVPGKVSGAPLIKGSRVRVEDILSNIELSPEEIADDFDLRLDDVRKVIDFYRRHHAELPAPVP